MWFKNHKVSFGVGTAVVIIVLAVVLHGLGIELPFFPAKSETGKVQSVATTSSPSPSPQNISASAQSTTQVTVQGNNNQSQSQTVTVVPPTTAPTPAPPPPTVSILSPNPGASVTDPIAVTGVVYNATPNMHVWPVIFNGSTYFPAPACAPMAQPGHVSCQIEAGTSTAADYTIMLMIGNKAFEDQIQHDVDVREAQNYPGDPNLQKLSTASDTRVVSWHP